ncbi:hypothetical protein BDV93DRAFT_366449 [Ceratobasidium sp. AG-I]|nr:hypothetical protein BDV93DRAFT_366449 [Ceratobasidium sp. AG-I]
MGRVRKMRYELLSTTLASTPYQYQRSLPIANMLPVVSAPYGYTELLSSAFPDLPQLELDEMSVADSSISPIEDVNSSSQVDEETPDDQEEVERVVLQMIDSGITEDHIISMMHNQTFAILTPTHTSSPYIVVSYVFDDDESTLAKENNLRPIQCSLKPSKNTTLLIVPELETMYSWSSEELEDEMEITSAEIAWWDDLDNFLDVPSPWSNTSLASSTSSDVTLASLDTPVIMGTDVVDYRASSQAEKSGNTLGLLDMHATAISYSRSYTYAAAIESWRTTLVHAGVTNKEDWSDDYECMSDSEVEVDDSFSQEGGMKSSIIGEEDEEN